MKDAHAMEGIQLDVRELGSCLHSVGHSDLINMAFPSLEPF